MKLEKLLIVLCFVLVAGTVLSSCKKEEDEDPVQELTETERLLTTNKWRYDRTINYGLFDTDTDTIRADQDTTETTRANRHLTFDMDGNSLWKDTAADTTVVEYNYTLDETQTMMRHWEDLSVQFFGFYSDHDYQILQLDANNLVLKGDQRRRSAEEGFTTYSIVQLEFTSF